MKFKLKAYLAQLEYEESFRGEGERRAIPSVNELARGAGVTRQQIYRILNGEPASLRLDTADGIITTLRRAGFPADVGDLLEYREPR